MRALIFLLALLAFSQAAHAQKYCARFYDDTQTCGIPSLRDCEQTVSGVGGDCSIDDTADIAPRPGPLQQWIEGQPGAKPTSPSLDDVPPPPGN